MFLGNLDVMHLPLNLTSFFKHKTIAFINDILVCIVKNNFLENYYILSEPNTAKYKFSILITLIFNANSVTIR